MYIPFLAVAVVVEENPQHLNVSRTDFFNLTCTVSSFPLPNITWLHNATTVIENSRITILETTTSRSITSTLNIENATSTDSGNYLCQASAPAGSSFNTTDSDTALILVQGEYMNDVYFYYFIYILLVT